MGAMTVKNTFYLAFSTVEPRLSVKTRLAGEYNLENALAAIAVGKYFEVSDVDIESALSDYEPTNRSQLIATSTNTVIMDAYNANPSSMTAAIDNFAGLEAENKLLILGDMLELGVASPDEHRQITDVIKRCGLWNKGKVMLIGKHFSRLNLDDDTVICFPVKDEAEEYLKTQNIVSHLILVKASRGTGLESLIKYL
jgi:UDP-N-acetylmuramoyl-tripeptide--D-alanyl-D-alanine ligase